MRQLTLFRPLPSFNDWPWVVRHGLIWALVIVNAIGVFGAIADAMHAPDWQVIVRAVGLAGSPELYELRDHHTFVWSPVAPYALTPLSVIGLWPWRLVLIASALAMPTWTARAVVLASWPFWADFAHGNILTVIFVAAVWAMRGSTVATWTFFGLALLRPMPLLAPMGLWILWKRPEWRWRFALLVAVYVPIVLSTGLVGEWMVALIAVGPDLVETAYNRGPTRFVGSLWLLIGLPLGAWLFSNGRVGWAGLAISPYIWSYYLYFALPAVNRRNSRA